MERFIPVQVQTVQIVFPIMDRVKSKKRKFEIEWRYLIYIVVLQCGENRSRKLCIVQIWNVDRFLLLFSCPFRSSCIWTNSIINHQHLLMPIPQSLLTWMVETIIAQSHRQPRKLLYELHYKNLFLSPNLFQPNHLAVHLRHWMDNTWNALPGSLVMHEYMELLPSPSSLFFYNNKILFHQKEKLKNTTTKSTTKRKPKA